MFGNREELKNFEYKGFTYDYFNAGDDDCDKLCHEVICGKTRIHFDWSPYSFPTVEQLKQFIDLGCPERISAGPLRQEDLDFIRGAGLVTWTFDLKSRDSDWSRDGIRVTAASERLVREIVAGSPGWSSCDILNLRLCEAAAQAEELSKFEADLESGLIK